MLQETLTNCPFCHQMTVKVLHIPFVANTTKSSCRAGGRNTTYQKEKFDVISGCEACGKGLKEVEKALNEGREIPFEERLKRLQESGLPTKFGSSKNG